MNYSFKNSRLDIANRFQTTFEIPHLALPYCILITFLVIISPLIPLLSRNESRSFNFNRVSKLQFSHEAKESSRADISGYFEYIHIYIYIYNFHTYTQRIELPSIFEDFRENTLDRARFDYHRNTGWKIVSDRAYASFRNAPESRIMSAEYIYIYYAVCFFLLAAIFATRKELKVAV